METSGERDVAAFRALFDTCSRPVLAYALRRVREPADAAEVVAETFLVAWRRLGEVPAGDAARPWLFGVARRVLANQRRGDRRRNVLEERLRAQLSTHVVLDHADATGAGLEVRAALARLDAEDRELLLLIAAEGLAPAEIALVLDVPAVTVRTRLHRARRRLERELRLGERQLVAGHAGADGRLPVRDGKGER